MLYYANCLEFITILNILILPGLSLLNTNYPILNITTFINFQNLNHFSMQNYGNFKHISYIPSTNYIYVVSNEHELLKLKLSNLNFDSKYSLKKQCTENGCEKFKIDVVQIAKDTSIMWICFNYRYHSNANTLESPMCYILNKDNLGSNPIGQWPGHTFISSDFEHRTSHLVTSDYTYSGFYIKSLKELMIFKNPLLFTQDSLSNVKKNFLPKSIIKDPGDFITSFEHNKSIYFLYIETDFLCGYKGNVLVTRLLRLCKNDNGLQSEQFTVFDKVNVECQQFNSNRAMKSFKYRIATNGHWLSVSKQLVVTFTNNYKEGESSAICVYSIQDIEDSFNSELKKSSEKATYKANEYKNICQLFTTGDQDRNFLTNLQTLCKTYPLHRTIVTSEAIFHDSSSKFIEIASEESPWSNNRRIILFVSTQTKYVKSLLEITLQPKICILKKFLLHEEITLLKTLNENDKTVLFIGTTHRLIKIPLDMCYLYITENQCSNPFCYWDSISKICTYISTENQFSLISNSKTFCTSPLKENQKAILNLWVQCPLKSISNDLSQIGICKCNIERNVGSNEIKVSISTDCQVDGDWTVYSSWSDCSVTCGNGTRVRLRYCDNPKPQNGGKECVGANTEYQMCSNKNCNELNLNTRAQYSSWTSWSACSKTCGFSFKRRFRKCMSKNCIESLNETKICNVPSCEIKIYSEWSSWSKFNITSLTKTRLRFNCIKTFQHELFNISFSDIDRYSVDPSCFTQDCQLKNKNQKINGKFSEWSEWYSCSNSCRSSEWTMRTRNCINPICFGATLDNKLCPLNLCKSSWNCWSTWTACLSSCETKESRMRKRKCIYNSIRTPCEGNHTEMSDCPLKQCSNAYTKWTEWSSCNKGSFKTRKRKCLRGNHCIFPLIQNKLCIHPLKDKPVEYSFIYMIVSGLVGMVSGSLIGSFLCYIWWKCTMNVIKQTYTESNKNSNSANQLDRPSVYDSQLLPITPDPYSNFNRQRSVSNSENTFINSSPSYFKDQKISYFAPNIPLMHSHLPEE